jgi:sulfur transfer complex TusBCD TusB component (DsrH family)
MTKQQTKKIKKCCRTCDKLKQINVNTNTMHRCLEDNELIQNINNNSACNFYIINKELINGIQ